MSQHERTNYRPPDYSLWHRQPNLPSNCFFLDVDWIEYGYYRGGFVILAIYESKLVVNGNFPQVTKGQWEMLSSFPDIPTFAVWHTEAEKVLNDAGNFVRYKIDSFWMQDEKDKPGIQIDERDWMDFIKTFHSPQHIEKMAQISTTEQFVKAQSDKLLKSYIDDVDSLKRRVIELERFSSQVVGYFKRYKPRVKLDWSGQVDFYKKVEVQK